MQKKMAIHHNLTGLIYSDNPSDRTIYCRKKHSIIDKLSKARPVGQAVKTLASHAGNMGSIPVRVTRE